MKQWKQVTKEEFDAFRESYPNELKGDIARMFEPPLGTWNDFTLGHWPESAVAKMVIMDGSDYYDGKTSEYFIRTDLRSHRRELAEQ